MNDLEKAKEEIERKLSKELVEKISQLSLALQNNTVSVGLLKKYGNNVQKIIDDIHIKIIRKAIDLALKKGIEIGQKEQFLRDKPKVEERIKQEREKIKKLIEEIWIKWDKNHDEIHPGYKKERIPYHPFCECFGIHSINIFKEELLKELSK